MKIQTFDPNFWGSGSPPYNNRGHSYCAAVSNGTRALHTMGLTNITISGSQTSDQRIEYQTIQTPGNSQLFGQLTQKAGYINWSKGKMKGLVWKKTKQKD